MIYSDAIFTQKIQKEHMSTPIELEVRCDFRFNVNGSCFEILKTRIAKTDTGMETDLTEFIKEVLPVTYKEIEETCDIKIKKTIETIKEEL